LRERNVANAIVRHWLRSCARLDRECDHLPAANAWRDYAALETIAPHGVDEPRRERCPGGADRVSARNRAAFDLIMSSGGPSSCAIASGTAAKASVLILHGPITQSPD
jgi:hypothetical protein